MQCYTTYLVNLAITIIAGKINFPAAHFDSNGNKLYMHTRFDIS